MMQHSNAACIVPAPLMAPKKAAGKAAAAPAAVLEAAPAPDIDVVNQDFLLKIHEAYQARWASFIQNDMPGLCNHGPHSCTLRFAMVRAMMRMLHKHYEEYHDVWLSNMWQAYHDSRAMCKHT